MKKKRNKKYNPRKAANNILIGTVIKWTVHDPLAEDNTPLYSSIEHSNPVQRTALEGIKKTLPKVVENLSVRYLITIEVEFNQDGKKYYRGALLTYKGKIDAAREQYLQTIQDLFDDSNMDHYVNTHVSAEIKPDSFRLAA